MTDADPDRLAELTRRLAALEARLGTDPAPNAGAELPDPDGDTFWALAELERRYGDAVLLTGAATLPGSATARWQLARSVAGLLDRDWSELAPALAALGHPVRLQLLQRIARDEASTAADLAGTDGLGSTGQIYHHLRQLVAAGWLRSTGRGVHVVPPERLVPLLVILAAC